MDRLRQFFNSTSPLTLLLTGLAIVYANGLFNHGLIPSMEPRFAQVVSEMMAVGEYLIPIKNGIPYVEYPPLLYWLAILFVKLGLPIEAAISVEKLIPSPAPPWFEHVLSIKAEKKVELFRVLPGANMLTIPDTPELAPVNWRDAKFDTD